MSKLDSPITRIVSHRILTIFSKFSQNPFPPSRSTAHKASTGTVIRNKHEYANFTRYLFNLIAILWILGLGFPAIILFSIQYGPIATLATMLCFIAFFAWRNEARKTGKARFDDRKPMRVEEYLKLLGGENDEKKK